MSTKKNTRIYADLDLDFKAHPLNGDIALKYNEEAVKRSIRHIILTNTYDRPFNPYTGAGIRELLFEPNTMTVKLSLETRIRNLIANKEPRATILEVNVESNDDRYEIDIIFSILNILEPVQTKIYLKRVR